MRIPNEKGSALLLVLMITLVLSAFGLVAMRDIARGVHQSASFRVRTQAATISDTATSAFSMRAGNQASGYLYAMKATTNRKNGSSTSFGGNDPSLYNYSGPYFQETLASHGGFIVFRHDELATGTSGLLSNPFGATSQQKGESGLFRGPASLSDAASFEVQNKTQFEVILRDIKAGIPAPGFSERYCFKKGVVAARSRVGEVPATLGEPARLAVGIHSNDILLGPVECGYN